MRASRIFIVDSLPLAGLASGRVDVRRRRKNGRDRYESECEQQTYSNGPLQKPVIKVHFFFFPDLSHFIYLIMSGNACRSRGHMRVYGQTKNSYVRSRTAGNKKLLLVFAYLITIARCR